MHLSNLGTSEMKDFADSIRVTLFNAKSRDARRTTRRILRFSNLRNYRFVYT